LKQRPKSYLLKNVPFTINKTVVPGKSFWFRALYNDSN